MILSKFYSDGCGRNGWVEGETRELQENHPPILKEEVTFCSTSPYLTTKVAPQQAKISVPKAERVYLIQLVLGLEDSSSECILCSVCPLVNTPQCHIRRNTLLGKTSYTINAFYLSKPMHIGLTQYIKL